MNLKESVLGKLKKNGEFSKNFVWRLVQTFGKQGTSFAIFLIATTFLSKSDMGIYNYVFSVLYLLTIFADFGISTATSKYVAEYNTVKKEKVKRVLFNTSLVVLIISIIVTILALIFGKTWFGDQYKYLLLVLPLVFFSPVTALYDGIYRGLKRFKDIAIISLVTGLTSLIAVLFFVKYLGLTGALLAQDFMYVLYFIILAIKYGKFEMSLDKKIIKDIGKYSMAFGIATLGYYLFSRINVLILGRYNLLEEIATYELLNKIFTVYLLPFSILGQVVAPYTTELFALRKYKDVKKRYWMLVKYLIFVFLLFVPVTMLFTNFVIKFGFSQYHTEMFLALLLPVTLTFAKDTLSAPLNAGMIVATGDAGIMTVLNIVIGAINVAASLFAIERWGYIGVIWTTLAIQCISFLVLHSIYIKRLNKYAKS